MRRYFGKHTRQCFIGYPNTLNDFIKNTPLHVIFLFLFSVFGTPDETLALAIDRLREARAHLKEVLLLDAGLRHSDSSKRPGLWKETMLISYMRLILTGKYKNGLSIAQSTFFC